MYFCNMAWLIAVRDLLNNFSGMNARSFAIMCSARVAVHCYIYNHTPIIPVSTSVMIGTWIKCTIMKLLMFLNTYNLLIILTDLLSGTQQRERKQNNLLNNGLLLIYSMILNNKYEYVTVDFGINKLSPTNLNS